VLIFLDAGHGGKDSGAAANGIKEKDVTLDICNRIQTGLKAYKDTEVLVSRSTDVYVSLDERTLAANRANADLVLSIHCNAATSPAANGFESYVYTTPNAATVAMQNVLHSEIMKALGTTIVDRGKQRKNLHMLRESKMKAILTENLFMSNPKEAALLNDSEMRQRIATAHVLGLEKFLGLKKAAQPPPIPEKLWYVQMGAFAEKENADALAADLMKQGYRPLVKYE
jgi:N-acetylmuramoyl-L-alanine amidase